MPSLAAFTIYLFGISAFAAGCYNLYYTEQAMSSFDISSACLTPMQGNALAAMAMGIYYSLAAWQENRTFFMLTVPMRFFTAYVFWDAGGQWRVAGIWEGLGAALTAGALLIGA